MIEKEKEIIHPDIIDNYLDCHIVTLYFRNLSSLCLYYSHYQCRYLSLLKILYRLCLSFYLLAVISNVYTCLYSKFWKFYIDCVCPFDFLVVIVSLKNWRYIFTACTFYSIYHKRSGVKVIGILCNGFA